MRYCLIKFVAEHKNGGSLTLHKEPTNDLSKLMESFVEFWKECPPTDGNSVRFSFTFVDSGREE